VDAAVRKSMRPVHRTVGYADSSAGILQAPVITATLPSTTTKSY
jgi:hypothetical protein